MLCIMHTCNDYMFGYISVLVKAFMKYEPRSNFGPLGIQVKIRL